MTAILRISPSAPALPNNSRCSMMNVRRSKSLACHRLYAYLILVFTQSTPTTPTTPRTLLLWRKKRSFSCSTRRQRFMSRYFRPTPVLTWRYVPGTPFLSHLLLLMLTCFSRTITASGTPILTRRRLQISRRNRRCSVWTRHPTRSCSQELQFTGCS